MPAYRNRTFIMLSRAVIIQSFEHVSAKGGNPMGTRYCLNIMSWLYTIMYHDHDDRCIFIIMSWTVSNPKGKYEQACQSADIIHLVC